MKPPLDPFLRFLASLHHELFNCRDPGPRDLLAAQEAEGVFQQPARLVMLLGLIDEPFQELSPFGFATIAPTEMLAY